jgi:hypothetical protein
MVIVNATYNARGVLSIGQLALLLICVAVSPGSLWAQKEPKPTSADNTSTRSQDGSSALSFSIESEMLTYRALESDSEAVACDIAAYLNGGAADFNSPPSGQVCTVNAGSANTKAGVVIVPFDRNVFDDFHLWRADMETMNELRMRAATYCPASPVTNINERGAKAPGEKQAAAAAGSALSFTPAGSALSLAQSALALMSSETSTSPVGGTIEDQAFMDGVARELRSLSVRVLMPTSYGPYSLSMTDESRSPFLSYLDKLFEARACLEDQEAKDDARDKEKEKELKSDAKDKEANRNAKASLIADIDAYLATLGGRAAAAEKPARSPSKPGDGCTEPQACGGKPAASPASSPSHLMAVLSADGLAQKLGIDPATGLLPDNGAWQHILLLKALESGGAIQKKSSIFGTKLRYSGGSIGTYALFALDGELECSGNVYDYGGSIPAEKLKEELRHYKPDPATQFIFQRGGCHAPAKH